MYGQVDRLEESFNNFKKTVNSENFVQNDNLQSLIFLTHYNSLMNIHFIKGEFFAGTKLIPEVELKMEKFKDKIDEHHYLILYLKMAALLFGSKKYPECISYAMKIINSKGNVQEDLLFHTRILVLMAKFESGIDEDYDEFVKATQKFVQKMKYSDEIHQVIIRLRPTAHFLHRRAHPGLGHDQSSRSTSCATALAAAPSARITEHEGRIIQSRSHESIISRDRGDPRQVTRLQGPHHRPRAGPRPTCTAWCARARRSRRTAGACPACIRGSARTSTPTTPR